MPKARRRSRKTRLGPMSTAMSRLRLAVARRARALNLLAVGIDLVIKWVRALLLLGLLGYFAFSLCVGLIKDETDGGFGRLRQGAGQDPGVRVLLLNRSGKEQPPEPLRLHESVELSILQTVDVVTPDDPENPERRLTLASGAKLVLLSDATDGLVLSSRDWGVGGKEYRWQVSRVHIQPQATSPAASPPELKAGVARRDPTGFEAADSDAVFAMQGRRYRGSAEVIWANAKELMVVNCIPLEGYTDGVTAVEMSPSYPLEALKAQAIASRSYAYARAWAARSLRQVYDVIDGEEDQDYRGTGNGTGLVTRAVFETRGTITFTDLAHGSYPFAPLFSASSGGYCSGIESVFPEARDAYGHPLPGDLMPAHQDPYCQPAADSLGYMSTHWQTSDVVKPSDIRSALAKLYKQTGDPRLSQIGFIKDLRVGRRNPQSNRVESVLITHTLDPSTPVELPAHVFRLAMGPSHIRSTLWSVDSPKKMDSPDGRSKEWQISCLGYGHGVGMSQISAVEMARQGLTAKAILGYFYPRVILRTIW